ncbi:probable E3 ubiquitin-protein ligase HERC4 [Heliangelus exortis]|uniref:probable E3 ubiquitin-protein ligase HERC4 n=1 Tax=Heliangelus exortis TaxID=472823 RepID=UPI003A8D1F8C
MGGRRQEQRRQRRRGLGRGTPQGTGETSQSQRDEKVQCSNHDATHLLVLSPDGKLSEQWTTTSAGCSKTKLVKELGTHDIVQIACGDEHAMALSRGGELFAWGHNDHGQLGVGSPAVPISQPQLVKRLKGIPLAHIATGGAHSIVVSLSGAVYSWGKNEFGQLGLGDTEDRYCPSYVSALEHWKTVFLACGADHTAALSKEGLVCTFGAGGAGQLGHNSTRNELVPRVVAELWGARVSQVACGSQHTLVYVPSLDKVYSFGCGKGRQLRAERKPHQLIPLPINSPVNPGKSCHENNVSEKGTEITARGNKIIALCKKDKNSYLNGIATLKDEDVDEWVSNSSPQHWEHIKKNIRLIFSSEACINGSFLAKRDKHFKTSKEVSGVDMSEVLQFYGKISKKPEVFQEVQKGIEKLLPLLSSSPISPENFRLYLILPFLLKRDDRSSLYSLSLLAQAITKLQPNAQQTLECLWSNLEKSIFRGLVFLYQRASARDVLRIGWGISYECSTLQINPCDENPCEPETLQILQTLYQVNTRAGFRLPENCFHMWQAITAYVLPTARCKKKSTGLFPLSLSFQTLTWNLTKYPCIFNFENKLVIHNFECKGLINPSGLVSVQHYWHFQVRRHCLLEDIWSNIKAASTEQFRMILEVTFEGEEGMDEGGLSQELFSIAARTLCEPSAGVFRRLASGLVWFPHSQAWSCEDTFIRIGTLHGMALFNARLSSFPFPRALYKKLLGFPPTLEDLEEMWPAVGRNLQAILEEECDQILESLGMDFTIMEEGGPMVAVELKKNGANIPVTKDNRKEFVDLYVNYMLNESIRKPFEDFMQGFLRGCPTQSWKMFLPVELQTVLQGKTVDWHLLEKNTVYLHYHPSDKIIRDFWTVFHKLPEEKKKMFFAFLSGSDQISSYGPQCFVFCIANPLLRDPDEYHPSANTCNHTFYLPKYSHKRILKEKLLYVIEHNEMFGML